MRPSLGCPCSLELQPGLIQAHFGTLPPSITGATPQEAVRLQRTAYLQQGHSQIGEKAQIQSSVFTFQATELSKSTSVDVWPGAHAAVLSAQHVLL